MFLPVSKSIVFPDRLRAKEDLDNTAGRQPVQPEDAWPCLRSLRLCICRASQMSFVSVKSALLSFFVSVGSGETELMRKCEVLFLTAVINVGHPVGVVLVFYVSVANRAPGPFPAFRPGLWNCMQNKSDTLFLSKQMCWMLFDFSRSFTSIQPCRCGWMSQTVLLMFATRYAAKHVQAF